ncbi:serine/threonine-protein kinase [Streptomyces tropicalis]|uniref:non-specific serine/threonine protein kinase n=1 Tax=Streptomyces tropicalis TaxID=3034234 RepID=A0ABT6A7C4_9ACTN|nr:serine/threonine-protein kinase [Streptomyces tropicalis]MDF3300550.1 serine/threonine-protein kinase [Streptomyces tropicalis]
MTTPLDTRFPESSRAARLAGRYELGELLGSGGAADVYRGTDLRLGRPVAVKVFRPGTATGLKDRFEDEALVLARLQHPGLVTVFDVGRHDGQAFLVVQLIEGGDLRGRINASAMAVPAVVELGSRLAEALGHVHGAGILHRDVKPSNILLDVQDRPYLTDFGISRPIDATASTQAGGLVGTAAYLSPEQVTGRRVEQRADIYALGLVLLECLKGRLEYEGTPMESAVARLHRAPRIPRRLPPELRDLLGSMTAMEAADRPDAQTCAAVLARLQRNEGAASASMPAGGVPDATQPDSECGTRREESRWASRHRGRTLAAAGAVVAATALGMTVPTWGSGASADRGPAATALPSPQKHSASADSRKREAGTGTAAPARSREPAPSVTAGPEHVTPAVPVPRPTRLPRARQARGTGHHHGKKAKPAGGRKSGPHGEHAPRIGPREGEDAPGKGGRGGPHR